MKLGDTILVTIMAVLIGGTMVFVAKSHRGDFDPPLCIMNTPRELIRGTIGNSGKLFFPGDPAYYLWYKGTREGSGEVCEKSVRVTAGRYEEQLYR